MAVYKQSKYMADAVLTNATSVGGSPGLPMANVARSGQLGSGVHITKLDGATPQVYNPVTGVVLTTPQFWAGYPMRQEFLKALMETHAKSITGIDFEYKLETADTPVGHDGQSLQVPLRTSRGQVSPTAQFTEMVGNPVYNLFRTWIFDIQHPDTNASGMPAWVADPGQIPIWAMNTYSMSMLFIQYDPTGLPDRIVDAYVIANMFPTGFGEMGFERSIGTTKLIERSVQFTGLVQHNENTRELGVRMAQLLQLHKVNYQFALPGVGGDVDPSMAIEKVIQDMGGLNYEVNGTPTVAGAVDAYQFLGDQGNEAYSGVSNYPSNEQLQDTSSVVPNPTGE